MAILEQWLTILQTYYLDDYIKSGASAFKMFTSPDSESVSSVFSNIKELCEEGGYVYVEVLASDCRIDRIEKLFFEIAKQIDWQKYIELDSIKMLKSNQYYIPVGVELTDIDEIARFNGLDTHDFIRDINKITRQEIFADRKMCKEFRTAVASMRRSQFFPTQITPTDIETISCWLQGGKVSLIALKDLRIYSKISRNNARDMISALSKWIAYVSGKGLVIGLDLSALLKTTKITDELHYSKGALLDAYEVLRQFIDDTDENENCLIIAGAPVSIITDEKRSLDSYYALKNRLMSEVHDKSKQNLLAALINLDSRTDGGL